MTTSPDTDTVTYRLTQYSHGAGCGCKISPKVLDHILKTSVIKPDYPQLLVGNEERDDAADECRAIAQVEDRKSVV